MSLVVCSEYLSVGSLVYIWRKSTPSSKPSTVHLWNDGSYMERDISNTQSDINQPKR